jgi:hypothetical protein
VTAPYTPVVIAAPGSVTGSVRFSGDAPVDTAITVTRDERVCGNTLTHIATETDGDRVIGALVWISDIRQGRPLPLARRFELVQTRCTFGPVLQPVIAGGALNVRTHDALVTQLVVLDTRTRDTVALLPFTSAGSLVPLDTQLRQPGMLEVRSATHPWMQAWVAVLDHPYFAMTDRSGAFRIEDVPPGRYELRAWHPRFGMTSGSVTIDGGGASQLDLRFNGRPDAALAADARSPVAQDSRVAATAAASEPGRQPSP